MIRRAGLVPCRGTVGNPGLDWVDLFGVKRRGLGLLIGICAVLAVIAVVVAVFVLPNFDPNHKTAVQVVQDAGVPAGATSGFPP